MPRAIGFELALTWIGNSGEGTADIRSFSRNHVVEISGKPPLTVSADSSFRGDHDQWNPEELLLAALSGCHMMSYFWVAVNEGIIVTSYSDRPTATLTLRGDGGGSITSVTLRPLVRVRSAEMVLPAQAAHARASELCFIAQSVNFEVLHEPEVIVESDETPSRLG
jgi:organic hydroperoxide reductase OsmC/OhrA